MASDPSYDVTAGEYARNRHASRQFILELQRGANLTGDSKVLEIGCGTGNYLAGLANCCDCRGWGVDPSQSMLSHAPRNERLSFSVGRAERLAFSGGLFDFVFSIDVIHHVSDTAAYFAESRRVLAAGGRLCTLTDSEDIIRGRKPLSEYWPETVSVDLARYPAIALLRQQMIDAGFSSIEERIVKWPVDIERIDPYRAKAYSCLHLISEDAFQRGLRALELALRARAVQGQTAYACLWGTVE